MSLDAKSLVIDNKLLKLLPNIRLLNTLTCQIIVQQNLLFFGGKNTYTTLLGPKRLLISEKSNTYPIKWSYTIIWQVRVYLYCVNSASSNSKIEVTLILGGETVVEEILAQDREYNQFDEIIGCIEDIGGFQLLDFIIMELKSHMTR